MSDRLFIGDAQEDVVATLAAMTDCGISGDDKVIPAFRARELNAKRTISDRELRLHGAF
jgi:hypothetical protein